MTELLNDDESLGPELITPSWTSCWPGLGEAEASKQGESTMPSPFWEFDTLCEGGGPLA